MLGGVKDPTGINPPAGPPVRNAVALTPRERECLRLLAAGESTKRIAFILSISAKTAQHHVANAKAKLGARNSVHAVAIAIERGLLRLSHER